jgi:hypothetical protein
VSCRRRGRGGIGSAAPSGRHWAGWWVGGVRGGPAAVPPSGISGSGGCGRVRSARGSRGGRHGHERRASCPDKNLSSRGKWGGGWWWRGWRLLPAAWLLLLLLRFRFDSAAAAGGSGSGGGGRQRGARTRRPRWRRERSRRGRPIITTCLAPLSVSVRIVLASLS